MNPKLLICVLASCVFLCANGAPQETETALISSILTTSSNANTTTTSSISPATISNANTTTTSSISSTTSSISSTTTSSISPTTISNADTTTTSFIPSTLTTTTTTRGTTTYLGGTYTSTDESPTSGSRPTDTNSPDHGNKSPSQGIFAFALWAKIVIPLVVIGALGFVLYCWKSHRKQKRKRVVGMLRSLDVVGEKEAQGEMKNGAGVKVARDVDGGSTQIDRVRPCPERDDETVRLHGF